ncbi:unnamed protein product [Caretta caretta]
MSSEAIARMENGKGEKTAPADPVQNSCIFPLDEPYGSDLHALVPTHDEHHHSIPEWKRQLMVRKLQARLEAGEGKGRMEWYCAD